MESISAFAANFKKTEAASYLKSATTKIKQMALNLTDLEVKVEEATNNEPWGPHGSTMAEISEAAYDSEGYRQIMGVIARRLQDTGELWRHVYKSLLLLEYMLKHGPQKVVQELSSNIIVIEKLHNFQYKDKNMRDHGENVRHRAKQLADLVLDPDRVREERKKAKELKSKYTGVSSDAMRGRGGLGSGGLGGGGGGRFDDSDEDDIYATRSSRASGGGGVDRGAVGQSTRNSDPVEATSRARIVAMSEREAREQDADEDGATVLQNRKLSNMRVDPKVSASLGLKMPAAPAPKPKPAAASGKPAVAALEVDLMGGLDDEPAPAAPANVRESSDWNAFEGANNSPAASTAAAASTNGSSWANFESAPSKPKTADPVADLFAMESPPAAVAASKPAAATDPFGDFGSASASAAIPTAAQTPPAPQASASLTKTALPEDIFSELQAPPPAVAHQPSATFAGSAPYGAAPPAAGGQFQQQQGFGFPAQQQAAAAQQTAAAQYCQAPAAAGPYGQQAAPVFGAFGTAPQPQSSGGQSSGSAVRAATGSGDGGATLSGKPQQRGVDPDPFSGLGW